jgi:hypothetical protein
MVMSTPIATTAATSRTTAAPTATTSTAAIAATVSTTIAAAVWAAITAAARRVAARGVVTGSKILRGRSVGFRLTLIGVGNLGILMLSGGSRSCSFFAFAEFGGAVLGLWRLIDRHVIGVRLIMVHIVVNAGGCEGLTRQQFDSGGRIAAGNGGERRVSGAMDVIVSMIVVFEVFEDITDVQEGVAIQADVDESRLHAWEDASNLAFVDAADERELFFTLDVDFD